MGEASIKGPVPHVNKTKIRGTLMTEKTEQRFLMVKKFHIHHCALNFD
jgi:hypothetical protein